MISLELPVRLQPSPGLTVRCMAMVAAARPWCEPLSALELLARNLANPLQDIDRDDWQPLIETTLDYYVRRMGLTCSNARATVTAMTMAWGLSARWVRNG